MLCAEFEDRLTDYIDGALAPDANRAFAEHALRCPVCHELLIEVKSALEACTLADVPPPSHELEARIMLATTPEAEMSCQEFEEYLTDYLDGFLPAALYHRWERHAAICQECTELPGQVVRAIGACYTYIGEEMAIPAGLHERILKATIGTEVAEEVRAPLGARIAALLRVWLDPIVSPQFATVATMLLVSVMVLTNTVSADGSIGGMYRASLRLAEQSYSGGSTTAARGATFSDDVKKIADGLTTLMSSQAGQGSGEKKPDQSKQPVASPSSEKK
jgi:anti-sigma factor RsiW